MNAISNIQNYLLKFKIKPSTQRIAIMDYLLSNRIHPTIDEIYNALYPYYPTLSKTTVYNTLKLFTEQKAVSAIVIDEKNIRYDINTTPHAHFMCIGCGKVYDFPVDRIEHVPVRTGTEYCITEIHIYYKGFCKNCVEQRDN